MNTTLNDKKTINEETSFSEKPKGGKKLSKKAVKLICIIASAVIVLGIAGKIGFDLLSKKWQSGELKMPAFVALTGYLQKDDFKYMDCVKIDGMNLAGLKYDEAFEKLNEFEEKREYSFTLTIKVGENAETVTEEDFPYNKRIEGVLEEAKQYCIDVMRGKIQKENKNFAVSAEYDIETLNTVAHDITEKLSTEPVDATIIGISKGQVNCSPEVDGYKVDENDLKAKLQNFLGTGLKEGEITPDVQITKASVTAESIKSHVVRLSSFTTTASNTENGISNMRLALNKCNGSVIAPGETWSFNKCTGDSNLKSGGWKTAAVISGGALNDGVGGGICQASTTIYNAAAYAGIKISERHYHLWSSGYIRAGMDATVDYPGLDLKLTNNTNYPMYLECYMSGVTLVARFYGEKQTWFDDIVIDTYETQRVEGEYYNVSTTRKYLLNGKVVKSESLPGSKYSLKERTWAPGSSGYVPPEPEPEPVSEEPEPTTETPEETGSSEETGSTGETGSSTEE